MKKVLLLWYQEGDNFGDILLYRTTRDFLSDLDIMVVSCEVGSPCIDVFEKANKTDFLLFAGGGIIEGIPSVIKYFEEDYKLLKVPYGVIGLGVSCFDYTNYSQQLRFWIENAKFFYVRDDYSANRLMKYTKLNNIKSSADCVFWNKELVKYGNALGGEIGINLRDIPEKLKIGGGRKR